MTSNYNLSSFHRYKHFSLTFPCLQCDLDPNTCHKKEIKTTFKNLVSSTPFRLKKTDFWSKNSDNVQKFALIDHYKRFNNYNFFSPILRPVSPRKLNYDQARKYSFIIFYYPVRELKKN